ncbi:Transmembrane protein 41A [Borealophlyctis nickersoniae]|nr:Transmembrane protein 41A [Borealophlyctis nickersoniae]
MSVLLIWRLAVTLPSSGDNLHIPKSIEDLKTQSVILRQYSASHSTHVFMLFISLFLFKQAFAVPGSALMNILAGTLYGFWGFPLVSLLTAMGSTFSYWLSQLFLGELLLERFARSKLQYFRRRVEGNKQNLFYYLLFLRLFPFSPSWFLNLASPFVGIPVVPFFTSVLFGLMPFNYVCVQAATTLSEVNSFSEILNFGILLRLMSISALALVPALYGERIASWVRSKLDVMPGSPTSSKHSLPFLGNKLISEKAAKEGFGTQISIGFHDVA